jgi:Icc protein
MLGIDTEKSFAATLQAARREHADADLFLLTGDLTQDPEEAVYLRLKQHLSDLPAPCYCIPGNHDDPALIDKILAGGNIYAQPRILLDRWQIILLDSTIPNEADGYLREEQLELLRALLAERPDLHTMVCLHHSPLPTGAAWLDTMMLGNAEAFAQIIASHPLAKTVVCGHVHQEMDKIWGNARLLACPSTCFQFKPNSKNFALDALPQGYRWLNLYPDGRIETQVQRMQALPEGLNMASGGY